MGETAAVSRAKAALLLVAASLALAAAGCGGGDDSGSAEPPATSTAPDGGGTGDAASGEQVFASAGCGGCHTFAAAGSTGSIGPNLDEVSLSFDAVVEQVTNGGGAMPAFDDRLTQQEIDDVAAFVTAS